MQAVEALVSNFPTDPYSLYKSGEKHGEAMSEIFIPLWDEWGATWSTGFSASGGGCYKTKGKVPCEADKLAKGKTTMPNTGLRSDPTDDFSLCKVAATLKKFNNLVAPPEKKK